MPTDEERREVAARLREWIAIPWYERPWSRDAMQSLGEMVGAVPGENIVERIADLIDRPTCRIGYVPCSADRSCSACGVAFSTGTYQGGDHEEHEFMFCPNCGAEVEP